MEIMDNLKLSHKTLNFNQNQTEKQKEKRIN